MQRNRGYVLQQMQEGLTEGSKGREEKEVADESHQVCWDGGPALAGSLVPPYTVKGKS
jgi:hypothetical protein